MDKRAFSDFYSRYCSACIDAGAKPLSPEAVAILVAGLGLRKLFAPLDATRAWKPDRHRIH